MVIHLKHFLAALAPQPLPRMILAPRCRLLKAAHSLGRLREGGAVAALCDLLFDPVSNLRKEAALALGEIADPASIDPLFEAISDPDPDARKAANLAYCRIKASHSLS
jgi:HEAT repeat protein